MVRTTLFASDEVSTSSKVDNGAVTAGKLLVKGASASSLRVGYSVVKTAVQETRTGTSREVVIGTAELAAVVKSAVGTAVVEAGIGASREVSIGAAESESAAIVEVKVGKAAVETGTGTSGGIEVVECAAVVESAIGTAAVETAMGTSRKSKSFTTGTVESAESTSVIGLTTSERVGLDGTN